MKTTAGKRFAAKLSARLARAASASAIGVAAAVDIIADEVRGLAPRRTGGLAGSVEPTPVVRAADVASASVVVSHPGVGAIEYGDRDMAAEPFLRPGFAASRGRALAALVAPIRHALR